jgi:hypothetical protein
VDGRAVELEVERIDDESLRGDPWTAESKTNLSEPD